MNRQDAAVLLDIRELQVNYYLSAQKVVRAVDRVSFQLRAGEALGIVGESGSGKSTLARAILRAVDKPGKVVGGEIVFRGRNLLTLSPRVMRQVRGKEVSMIFQDPTTSLDPLFTIGDQLTETLAAHERLPAPQRRIRLEEALSVVGISDVDEVLRGYPSDFSAGFRQRIMIAMAMLCRPYLVIADEPTTTLGATVQASLLDALYEIQQKTGTAVIFITHDFGVVSQFTTNIMVMYAGKCVEYGPKDKLLLHPTHPYTVGLIRSVPLIEARRGYRLETIPGFPPDMLNLPPGCPFAARCEYAQEICRVEMPNLSSTEDPNHQQACHFPVAFETGAELVLEDSV
jgi:oligopeptide/dipeptide ABC transporter ATP-binding protein